MTPLFEERQRGPFLGVLGIVAAVMVGLVVAGRAGWDEAMFTVGMVGVVLAIFRMRTTVTSEELQVVLIPVPRKSWPLADVERCEIVRYRPLLHYGGWGWRWGGKRGWAYTTRGNRGVVVHLRNGKKFLVGSQRPEELAAAIDGARRDLRPEA